MKKVKLSMFVVGIIVVIVAACGISEVQALPNKWTIVGPGGGGREFNIAVDPIDPNILYVGTDMLGVYKSTNKGDSWDWSNKGVIYNQAGGVAVDPTNHNTVYQSDLKGVYKSINGGQSWVHVYQVGKVPGDQSECTNPPTCIYNHRQMLVGIDGTVYVPTQTGEVVIGREHGTVWEQLDIGATSEINSIVSPSSGVIIVGTESNGIIRYETGGVGTKVLPNVQNIRDIAIHPGAPTLLYALAGAINGTTAVFYCSTDSGLNWTVVKEFYAGTFDISSGTQKFIAVNSSGTIILINGHLLERSSDGGATWERILDYSTYGSKWHTDGYIYQAENNSGAKKVSIAADPSLNSTTWYVTSWLGVGRSVDNGDNWYFKVDGLKVSGISKCLEDPNNSSNVYCAVLDNQFIMSRDGGSTWTSTAYMINNGYYGDMVDLVFDPDDSGKIYSLVTQPNDAYILRGQDSGGIWTWEKLKVVGNVKNGFGNIRFDPMDHNKIYVSLALTNGTVGVLAGTNQGTQWDWDWMNTGLPVSSDNYLQFMDIASNGNLYLGTYNEGLYKYDKNLSVWGLIYMQQGLRKGSLSIDPNNPDILWVGCSTFGGEGACTSTNAGYTWTRKTEELGYYLGDYFVASTHTTKSGVVFIEFWHGGGILYGEDPGSDLVGVWYSVNNGSTWTKFINGMPDPRVRTFTSNGKKIWAATYTSPIYFECTDNDGDGYSAEVGPCATPNSVDCNDNDAFIHPGTTEICDGIDNNCNGQIDEGVQNTYYQDADGDGYGNPAISIQECSLPSGYVDNSTDDDDTNMLRNGGFELDFSDWTRMNDPIRTVTSIDNNYHNGLKSAKVYFNNTDSNYRHVYQVVPVQPSTTYFLEGFIKTDQLTTSGHAVNIQARDNNGRDYNTNEVSGTTDWSYVSKQFTTSADATTVEIRLMRTGGSTISGTAWWDDIKLHKVAP